MDPQTPQSVQDLLVQQAQLARREQLAQALMSAQAPAPYSVVPGETSKGSGGGGWVVPNKFGGLSTALQNVMGAYMGSKTDKSIVENKTAQTKALLAALQGTTGAGLPQGQATPGAPPQGGNGSEINAPQPGQGPAPQASSSQGMLDLMMLNPASANQMLMPKYERSENSQTGEATAWNPYNPQGKQVQIGGNTGAINPKLIDAFKAQFNNADFTNPQVRASAETAAQAAGLKPKGSAPWQQSDWEAFEHGGQLSNADTQAGIGQKQAGTAEAQANTAFTTGVKTAHERAETGLAGASTASANQERLLKGTEASSGASQELAEATHTVEQDQRALQLINQLRSSGSIGGKPLSTWNQFMSYLGDKPEYAELKSMLTIDALKATKDSLGNNKMAQAEYKVVSPTQISADMPIDAMTSLLGMKTKYDTVGLGIAHAKAQGTQAATGQAVSNIPTPSGGAPTIGMVSKGHVYIGGDPSLPASWAKANQ
jgi:hypothetical protein